MAITTEVVVDVKINYYDNKQDYEYIDTSRFTASKTGKQDMKVTEFKPCIEQNTLRKQIEVIETALLDAGNELRDHKDVEHKAWSDLVMLGS